MGYKARKPIPSSLVGSKRGNPHVFEYTKFSRPCLRIWDNDGQQPFFFWIFLICFFYVICIFFSSRASIIYLIFLLVFYKLISYLIVDKFIYILIIIF
jgi:hypothetical protein